VNGEAGHFSVAVSAPGIYTIRSFVSSIGGTQHVIAAAAGYPTYMKMFITGGSASVSGTVTSGGTPVEGAIVSFSLGSAVTNAAGSYQVPYVPGGDFIFSVTAPRFSVASQTVHVVSGSSLSGINFEVVPLTTATGAITGSVSGPFGTIGGATVSYNGGSTTTDVAGSYTLSNLSTGTITVMASASGYESSSQAVSVTGGATAIANFILVSTGTIAGTVKNSTGTAISGAAVSYSGGSTTTDVSGNYTLSKVPAGTITVVASANGYQSSSQVVSVAGAATATANFTLTLATGTITGTVKNSSGTAISGAAVSYSGGSTTTDAAGSYALTNVPAGAVSVSASTAGYVAATQNVTVNLNVTATANFTLSAVPPGSIAGTVKNSSGVAINAATVSYAGDSTQTNSSGVYTFSQAPVGTVLLSATAPAYQTSTQSVAVISNVATTANFTLLSTSGEITGVVTNRATAAAIGGATVQISGGTSTTTNAQGAYTFTKVTAGTYTLAASAAGYQQNTNSAVVSSGATSTLNFSLNPLAKIAGTVTDSVTAAGIGNATIQIAGGSSTKTSGSGAYSLNNVSIDNPTIFVTAAVNGYLSVTQSSPVSSGATTTQNFALTQSTGALSGTIMNSAGKPINGAVVSYNGGSTKTKANGTYILKNVPVGTISLSASAGGYQTSTRDVTIAGGVTTTANFNLQ